MDRLAPIRLRIAGGSRPVGPRWRAGRILALRPGAPIRRRGDERGVVGAGELDEVSRQRLIGAVVNDGFHTQGPHLAPGSVDGTGVNVVTGIVGGVNHELCREDDVLDVVAIALEQLALCTSAGSSRRREANALRCAYVRTVPWISAESECRVLATLRSIEGKTLGDRGSDRLVGGLVNPAPHVLRPWSVARRQHG